MILTMSPIEYHTNMGLAPYAHATTRPGQWFLGFDFAIIFMGFTCGVILLMVEILLILRGYEIYMCCHHVGLENLLIL